VSRDRVEIDVTVVPAGATRTRAAEPTILATPEHPLCPGCGEPLVFGLLDQVLSERGAVGSSVAVVGIGCYTAVGLELDLDMVQALHGRAPSVATGVRRMLPDATVFTVQGDGDMVNEGLQEVLHTAARGEAITCVLLNNGVFGETGGQMTAASSLGQRTKTSLEGRDPARHGWPIRVADLVAQLDGARYVARGAVANPGLIRRTRRMLERAFEVQADGGFSLVEILTMCPTGWFVDVQQGPAYMQASLGELHAFGELKAESADRN
jgi:2-oxoglutarate/2-oxoacid ferredoxin oxidoreductase subunit beta